MAEHAPSGRRGAYTSWIQTTATVGLMLALMVILASRFWAGGGAFSPEGRWLLLVLVLAVMVLYVTMVYGPIAAMLVEMFPTRIRYTSMSLPYHIGNGWFGGFLPAIASSIVAAKGNIYSGLWYPIIIASVTFVIGLLFVKETKDSDVYHQ